MKLDKATMARNREDMADFARTSGNTFYAKALADYEAAQAVLALAREERDQAFNRLAMQIKLTDAEEYLKVGLDWNELNDLEGGERIIHLIKKGKFRLGHTYTCRIGLDPTR